jgi:anti-sigma B factor antagonist
MKIKINQGSDIVRIIIEGNLESTTIKPFTEKVANIPGLGKNVEVDLEGVDYIDSSGIRSLLTLASKLKETDQTLSIINCSDNIRRILKFSSLQGV